MVTGDLEFGFSSLSITGPCRSSEQEQMRYPCSVMRRFRRSRGVTIAGRSIVFRKMAEIARYKVGGFGRRCAFQKAIIVNG
jgi:hypothetical protein